MVLLATFAPQRQMHEQHVVLIFATVWNSTMAPVGPSQRCLAR
jgi:hypothetical protein